MVTDRMKSIGNKFAIWPLWFCLVVILLAAWPAAGMYSLDRTFGDEGRISSSSGGVSDRGYGIAVQQDGKLIVAGARSNSADFDFALTRFLADGSPDASFNFDGRVTTALGRYNDEAFTVDLFKDGRIIAAGYSAGEEDRDFALACYLSDGSLDSTFGREGMVVTPVGGASEEITAIVVDEAQRVVAVGAVEGTNGRVIGVARYLNNGDLDPEFGDEGISLVGLGSDAVAQGILVQPNGRIVVSGTYREGNNISSVLVGLKEDGSLDPDFGVEGIGVPHAGLGATEGYGIAAGDDGEIYLAASIEQDGNLEGALLRFTDNGLPDTGFHGQGYIVLVKGPEDDVLYDVKITPDGDVVAGGYTTDGGIKRFLLVTYEGREAEALKAETQDVEQSGQSVKPVKISSLKVVTEESSLDGEPVVRLKELQVLDSLENYNTGSKQTSAKSREQNKFAGDGRLSAVKEKLWRLGLVVADFLVPSAAAAESSSDIDTGNKVSLEFEQGNSEGSALAITGDGKVVVVGTATDGQSDSLAVAKFAEKASASGEDDDAATSEFILTKEATEITRTGAFTGGEILSGLTGVTKRGVVFSIAQDPVYKESGSEGGDSSTLTVSITNPVSGSEVTEASTTLSATSSQDATCGYNEGSDIGFESMTKFPGSAAKSHSVTLTGLTDGDKTYFVRCRTSANLEGVSSVKFTVAISTSAMVRELLRDAAGGLLLVREAHAQDDDSDDESDTGLFGTSGEEDFDDEGNTEDGAGVGRYSSILKNLRPGTTYYVRAYAQVGSSVLYGNQISFRTADSCFIATASYGSILHPYVETLRTFRDRFLIGSTQGRELVDYYYRVSPPIADYIAAHPLLKLLVRVLLLPLVGFSWMALHIGFALSLTLMVGILGLCGYGCLRLAKRFGLPMGEPERYVR